MAENSILQSTAFAFPGIGIEQSGKERALYARHCDIFDNRFGPAQDFAGCDLRDKLGLERIADELEEHYYFYAFSCAMFDILTNAGIAPSVIAGYSFGAYAALYASGTIDYAAGLEIIRHARAVVDDLPAGDARGMGVVVGLLRTDIIAIQRSFDMRKLIVVNCNNDTCYVIAGDSRDVDAALDMALKRDAVSAVRLPAREAYHHPNFLTLASGRLAERLETIEFRAPRTPLISSIDQTLLDTPQKLRAFIGHNLATPIHWLNVVRCIAAMSVTQIIECGPGVSLTQNGRFIDCPISYANIRTVQGKFGI